MGRGLWLAVACLLAACGRFGFDAQTHVAADGRRDAPGTLHASYLKASNTGPFDWFGSAIALSADGTTLAVGAYDEFSNATGIDGNQTDHSATAAGAVYIFARSGATWVQQAYVKASNTDAGDQFGAAVALAADGSTLAVGAPFESSAATGIDGNQTDNSATNAGAVYVFVRAGTTWSQQAYVKASNTGPSDQFGEAVALSGDGATLAVGAPGEASAATGVGGNQADNSAGSAGAVYLLVRAGTAWSQQAYVKASNTDAADQFGFAVALTSDGSTLAVGANGEDSGATGIDGNQADNSQGNAGAAYVFTRAGAAWSQQAYVKGSVAIGGDFFGQALALSGDTLAVGSPGNDMVANAGVTFVFVRSGTTWSQQALLLAPNAGANDQCGTAVALSGDLLLVGSQLEDSGAAGLDGNENDESIMDSGAVYLFARTGTTWTAHTYIKALAPGLGDHFGTSLALASDGSFAVGAQFEDSSTTGIDSTPDEAAQDSGAAYSWAY